MSELDQKLAALFGPKKPAAASTTTAPDPFFQALAAKKTEALTVTVAPSATPAPFSVPETFRAKPSATIDIREAATSALDKVGYYKEEEGGPAGPSQDELDRRAFLDSLRPQVSGPSPVGLFRGIAKAGKKPKTPPKPRVVKDGAISLKDLFGLDEEPQAHPASRLAEAQRRAGVPDSYELQRILKIERRPSAIDNAPDLTPEFRKPSASCGETANNMPTDGLCPKCGCPRSLWKRQSAALHEARKSDGMFGPIGVGQGKTLISLLMGAAMRSRQVVLLVPPALRAQLLQIDIPRLAKHWNIQLDRIRIVSYSQISNAKSAEILEEINPDVIVADEAHNLRHKTAARTKRFLRFMKEHPGCRFVPLSGTMTRRSLHDYGHLSELALKKNSPVPGHYVSLDEWAQALDVSDDPRAPGALLALCSDDELARVAKLAGEGPMQEGTASGFEIQEIVRGAFRRRLVETPGVVATDENAIGTSLTIQAVRPMVPAEVMAKIKDVRYKWEIDGEELVDPLSVARVTRQLAAGFRYHWVWPDGVVDDEWMQARKEWNKEVREILRLSRRGLDSPMLIAKACERGDYDSRAYDAWRKVKERYKPTPPTEAVWISDFLVQAAIKWASDTVTKTEPGIIWYSHACFGERLAEASGFPFFGPGHKAGEALTQVNTKATPAIICSIASHGTGKNLQAFCHNLVTTPPSGGVEWEQMVARTHRPGQLADEVTVDVYVHTIETEGAFRSAVKDAKYIEQTQGQPQKLNYAEKLAFGAEAFVFSAADRPETDGIEWQGESDLLRQLRASVEQTK